MVNCSMLFVKPMLWVFCLILIVLILTITGVAKMDLQHKKCQACEGMAQAMPPAIACEFMTQIPAWELAAEGKSIRRQFEFKGFSKVMLFLNAVAWIVQQEGHHPDICFG